MEILSTLFQAVLGLFKTEFTVFGFPLSFWQVFIWSAVASIIIFIIRELFLDD